MKFLIGLLVYLLLGVVSDGIIEVLVALHMHPTYSMEHIANGISSVYEDALKEGWRMVVICLAIHYILWPLIIPLRAIELVKTIEEYKDESPEA